MIHKRLKQVSGDVWEIVNHTHVLHNIVLLILFKWFSLFVVSVTYMFVHVFHVVLLLHYDCVDLCEHKLWLTLRWSASTQAWHSADMMDFFVWQQELWYMFKTVIGWLISSAICMELKLNRRKSSWWIRHIRRFLQKCHWAKRQIRTGR